MFNLFNRSRQDRIDRLEEGFIQLNEQAARTNNLLEQVITIQEHQQTTLNQHESYMERILGHIDILYGEVRGLHEEIRGLRTESLRIQRHIFGDEVDGN